MYSTSQRAIGFKREPAEFLGPGDTVRVTIEVGVLENPVVVEEAGA